MAQWVEPSRTAELETPRNPVNEYPGRHGSHLQSPQRCPKASWLAVLAEAVSQLNPYSLKFLWLGYFITATGKKLRQSSLS